MKNISLISLSLIFLLSVALRWYNLPKNLFFGFEQGRDAQIISDIFYKHEFKLVGPKTDLAGIFHGAYYYYLLLPACILSHGNPLAASFFLIVLSSLTIVIAYFFGRDFFGSPKAGIVTALLVATSYEYIIYARWLSNVTPAIPLILLTFWLLWKYHLHKEANNSKKTFLFVSAVTTAIFAAQFEIVLLLLLGWVFVCLLLSRIIRWPSWKELVAAILITTAIFVPHIIFNLRNQNIIVNSLFRFMTGTGVENTKGSLNLATNLQIFGSNYMASLSRSLSLPNQPIVLLFITLVIVLGVIWSLLKKQKITSQKEAQQKVLFLIVWVFMCFPILFFHDVANLIQLYLGVGLAIIFLFVFALQTVWHFSIQQKPIGKIIAACCGLILIWGMSVTIQRLQKNENVFFVTVQTDLNYADQQRVLQYIHSDAQGQIYRFVSYTIPYSQPQGWQYLRQFLYPQDQTDDGSKLVYIIIEQQVDPYWQKRWTEELGTSTLMSEQTFGLIRVQKRTLQ